MIENYFLGCNSSDGFYSLYNELYNNEYKQKIYILKGGPGTGKSSIMKAVAERASEFDYNIEKIYCSSDPNSLDAVIIKDLNIIILDGTAPHILEPKYPGVIETIINLGQYWNEKLLLKNKNEIIKLSEENKNFHNKCINELIKMKKFQYENTILLRKYINNKTVNEFINFSFKNENKPGKTKKRILTAVTPNGIITLNNNFDKEITFINDKYDCVSKIIMKNISNINLGDKVICSDYTGSKNINFVISDKNIYTNNGFIHYDKIINADDFYFSIPKTINNIAIENKNIIAEFLNNAVEYSQKAKAIHNKLEKYYIDAMNFDKINIITKELVNKIFN